MENIRSIKDSQELSDEEKRQKIEDRRTDLRKILLDDPVLAYQSPDFEPLMREEISRYTSRVLREKIEENLEAALDGSDRFRKIYDNEYHNFFSSHDQKRLQEDEVYRSRIEKDALRSAIMKASYDGRTLGQLETLLLDRIYYGLPIVTAD